MAFTYIVPYAEEAGNVSNTANITINSVTVTGNASVGNILTTNNLTVTGNASFTGPNVSLGNVSNLHITGGTSNYFLQTDGNGNLSWASVGSGNSISNGTSNVSIPTANGNVNISTNGNANIAQFDTNGALILYPTTASLNAMRITSYGSPVSGDVNRIASFRYRGNASAPLSVQPNDATMRFLTVGYNGSALQTNSVASIRSLVDSSYTANGANIPLGWNIQVNDTNGGTNNQTKNHYFYSNGNVSFANSLVVNNDITSTSGVFYGNGAGLTNINGGNISNVANANYANYAGNAFSVSGSNVSGQVGNALIAGTVYTNAQPNITSVGTLVDLTVSGNANLGNAVTANYFIGSGNNLSNIQAANVIGTVANANYATNTGNANLANYVIQSTQSNITRVGTLTALTVNGIANFNSTTNFTDTVTFTGSNTYIANVSNLHIPGGINGYFLQTDGVGNLAWVNGTTTGNGVVGGSNTQVQYNNAGNFGGSAGLTFNSTSNTLTTVNLVVTGNLTATINTPITSSNIFITNGQFINVNPNSAFNNLNILDGTVIFNSNAVTGSSTANSNVQVGMSFNIRGNSTTSLNSLMQPGDKLTIIYHQPVTQPAVTAPPYFTNYYTIAYIRAAPILQIDGSNVSIYDGSANRFLSDPSNGYYGNGFASFISTSPAGVMTSNISSGTGGVIGNAVVYSGSGGGGPTTATARFAIIIYKLDNTPTWSGYFSTVQF